MNVINLPQYGVLSYSFKDVLSSLKEPLGPLGTALNSLHCLSIRQRFGKPNTSTDIFALSICNSSMPLKPVLYSNIDKTAFDLLFWRIFLCFWMIF